MRVGNGREVTALVCPLPTVSHGSAANKPAIPNHHPRDGLFFPEHRQTSMNAPRANVVRRCRLVPKNSPALGDWGSRFSSGLALDRLPKAKKYKALHVSDGVGSVTTM